MDQWLTPLRSPLDWSSPPRSPTPLEMAKAQRDGQSWAKAALRLWLQVLSTAHQRPQLALEERRPACGSLFGAQADLDSASVLVPFLSSAGRLTPLQEGLPSASFATASSASTASAASARAPKASQREICRSAVCSRSHLPPAGRKVRCLLAPPRLPRALRASGRSRGCACFFLGVAES